MNRTHFFPRSIRNRIAMVLGLISLILCITWNLLPDYVLNEQKLLVPKGYFLSSWTQALIFIFEYLIKGILYFAPVQTLTFLMIPLLVMINLTILPAWNVWQSSVVLRILATLLMMSGLLTTIIFMKSDELSALLFANHFRLIAINFLTTALCLQLFKNENLAQPDHGISST